MSYYILYVEDEAILGQLVQEALEKAGYEVCRVTAAATAIREYRRRRPHLALLDVMLSDSDGYQLAAQIRATDKELPIIFLTAKVAVADVVSGFGAGCNDYIRKPFSTDELLLRIGRWLEERYAKARDNPAGSWVMGNCTFSPAKSLLETRTESYRLTYKEAEVLRILYHHRQTAVGRDYLLLQVWGADTIYTSRILDVYISKLRKYLRQSGAEIITLKGIGYRFITEGA